MTNSKRMWMLCAAAAVAALAALAVEHKAPAWGRRTASAAAERRGDLCFQAGRTRAAETSWRSVLQESAESAGLRNKLAVLCMNDGRFDDARDLLEKGIRINPRTVSFHYNMGLLCYMERDYDGSLACLSRVEELYPGHGNVHFLKGVVYDKLGKESLARKEFIKELNCDPATPAAWVRVGGQWQ